MSAIPRVDSSDPAAAVSAIRAAGAVIIDRLVPVEAIDDLRGAIERRHPEFANKASLSDFQDNGRGRFIAPVAISRAVHASGLLQHPALAALAAGVLGPDWVVGAFGLLMAFPGCDAQDAHRDGAPLFPETTLSAILPAYALTAVVPLVDVIEDNGPTAVQLGTHRYAPGCAEVEAVTAPVPRGSALIWDFETLHRGLPNRSDQARPALYFTLCRPFWIDTANFGGTARTRLAIDDDVLPLLGRRFARGGDWH